MEGFILTVEGCPYAFTTNGISGITPTHTEWASTWTMMENVLVNPTEYINWNERTLPIEGDLEVDGITFKLNDKFVDQFPLYDGSTFSGSILTELFTRGSARQNPYFLNRSLVSVEPGGTNAYSNEISLFGEPVESYAQQLTHYKSTWISGSYNFSGSLDNGMRPVWIEDEAMNIVNFSGVDSDVLIVGTTLGVEGALGAGRGYYGTEKKYHRIKDTYKPEISFKHPLIIKRGVMLWRVSDTADLSDTSIYPIWRGYAQSNPELASDGSVFEIRAEHKWNIYKNETMDYAGFKYKFSIPTKTFTKVALHGLFSSSLNWTLIIQPDFGDWPLGTSKFTTSAADAFLGLRTYSGVARPALRQRVYALTNNSSFTYRAYPSRTDSINKIETNIYADDAVLSPSVYNVGGRICGGQDFWSPQVNHPDQTYATSPVLPKVAIDYKQNVNGYHLKYAVTSRTSELLPENYLILLSPIAGTSLFSGPNQVVIRHVFQAESDEDLVVLTPSTTQVAATNNAKFIKGNITSYNKDTLRPTVDTGIAQYIKEPLAFTSALSVNSTGTTIETLFKTMLRPRSAATVFNSINVNDFDISNLEILKDWVSGIEPGNDINWFWDDSVKFMDYIQPYMKFFNYIVCLKGAKIRFNTYDPTRPFQHTLTTADFVEAPSNLATLPENLFNTVKYKAPNYDTEYVFNDDLSKGRYKVGNTQEIELPASVGNISSPTEMIGYFQSVAQRFLSIWGYPQYVFKCKTSLSKINIELGDIVQITDWLVPDFSPNTPTRGIVARNGIVVERNVDLTTATIGFSIVYQEEAQTSFYSPCIRILGANNLGGNGFVTGSTNYIRPSNKIEPTAGGFSNSEETSDYCGSNRFGYRGIYGIANEDGGVSPFEMGNRVELILRDSTTQAAFSGSGGTLLEITNVDPVTSIIKFNQDIDATFLSYINTGEIVDMRFANYQDCDNNQKAEYGFIGDFTFESLDSPVPVPPAVRVVGSTQFSP